MKIKPQPYSDYPPLPLQDPHLDDHDRSSSINPLLLRVYVS